MERPKQEAKCPKCGQDEMKMVMATSPLTEAPKVKSMQAHCTTCILEDDYTKIYPFRRYRRLML